MNFQVNARTQEYTVADLEAIINARHGDPIQNLEIYKDAVSDENKLPVGASDPVFTFGASTILYDYYPPLDPFRNRPVAGAIHATNQVITLRTFENGDRPVIEPAKLVWSKTAEHDPWTAKAMAEEAARLEAERKAAEAAAAAEEARLAAEKAEREAAKEAARKAKKEAEAKRKAEEEAAAKEAEERRLKKLEEEAMKDPAKRAEFERKKAEAEAAAKKAEAEAKCGAAQARQGRRRWSLPWRHDTRVLRTSCLHRGEPLPPHPEEQDAGGDYRQGQDRRLVQLQDGDRKVQRRRRGHADVQGREGGLRRQRLGAVHDGGRQAPLYGAH